LIAFQRPFLHLLPLVDRGLAAGASVAVFAERDLPPLSPEVEVVQDVRDALAWADFLAIEAPASDIGTLRKLTGAAGRVPLPAQILVETELACGLGVCGACSVKARRGWKLACRDGPVFDLNMLDW
jgi:hypothetical protein